MTGTVTVVTDTQVKKKLWNERVKTMFAKEVEDPRVVLIQVKLDTAEYWESDGLVKSALEVITSKFKDEKPNLGGNETIDI